MRPFLVTLIALLVLTITGLYLVRLFQTLSWWEFLASLPRVSPGYLALTGLFWTSAGVPVFIGLWLGRPGTPRATRLFALGFSIYWWLERYLVTNADKEMINLPFVVGITILLLFIVLWTFSRPMVKEYFGELHEQSREN